MAAPEELNLTVTIPAADVEGTKLAGIITARGSLATSSASNGPLALAHTLEQQNAQLQLVMYLMSTGKLKASTILANETYGT